MFSGGDMKKTQAQAILSYLRKHKRATNMELSHALWVACVWKRIRDAEYNYRGSLPDGWGGRAGQVSTTERITRRFIKTATGKRVVQYELERVK